MRSANDRRRTSRGMVKERKGDGAGNSELAVDKSSFRVVYSGVEVPQMVLGMP